MLDAVGPRVVFECFALCEMASDFGGGLGLGLELWGHFAKCETFENHSGLDAVGPRVWGVLVSTS